MKRKKKQKKNWKNIFYMLEVERDIKILEILHWHLVNQNS